MGSSDPQERELDATWAGRFLESLNLRSRRSRAIATVAVAVALVIGIGWLLAGAGAPAGTSAGGDGIGEPVRIGPAGEDAGQSPTPVASAAVGSGEPGEEPAADGDQGPGNGAPVIEDAGLSSDGLLLRIAPSVTDPEGGMVSLLFEVDGEVVDPARTCFQHPSCKGEENPAAEPAKASVQFRHTEVGYRHLASVTIIATDGVGATTRESFTHELTAIAGVRFDDFRFTVAHPEDCFREEPERALSVQIRVSGPVTFSASYSQRVSAARPSILLGRDRLSPDYLGEVPPALEVSSFRGTFAGLTTVFPAPRTYQQSQDVVVRHTATIDGCEGQFSYRIRFTVR